MINNIVNQLAGAFNTVANLVQGFLGTGQGQHGLFDVITDLSSRVF